MECPGCTSYSSSVAADVGAERPCRVCGLSADAILEITSVRQQRADEELKMLLEKAIIERDRAQTEAAKLRGLVTDARRALGCEVPFVPHDALNGP
jgi:hypothetical protein